MSVRPVRSRSRDCAIPAGGAVNLAWVIIAQDAPFGVGAGLRNHNDGPTSIDGIDPRLPNFQTPIGKGEDVLSRHTIKGSILREEHTSVRFLGEFRKSR